jgi:hypothetical protein
MIPSAVPRMEAIERIRIEPVPPGITRFHGYWKLTRLP